MMHVEQHPITSHTSSRVDNTYVKHILGNVNDDMKHIYIYGHRVFKSVYFDIVNEFSC